MFRRNVFGYIYKKSVVTKSALKCEVNQSVLLSVTEILSCYSFENHIRNALHNHSLLSQKGERVLQNIHCP